jgi:hypothetical protein
MSDDFFALPAFKPLDALQRLKRELRALGLSEREARFERRGVALVRLWLEGDRLNAAVVRAPARSPDWQARALPDQAAVRAFLDDVRQRLARWQDVDD